MSGPELRSIQGIDLAQESQTQPIHPKPQPPIVDKVMATAPTKLLIDEADAEALEPLEPEPKNKSNNNNIASEVSEAVEPKLSNSSQIQTPAGPSRPLSLAEARAAALQSNLDLAVALVDPAIAR